MAMTRVRVPRSRVQRQVAEMVAGQRMAAAEPSETDIQIAARQAAGELTADQAVAEAVAAARARFHTA